MKNVLVTGADGYLGRAFAAAFGNRYRIKPFTRTTGDVRNLEDLLRESKGMDAVLHLAAVTTDTPGATDADYFQTNTVGTFNVLAAAVESGVKKVVYASSVCAVGFRASTTVVYETDRCEPSDGMYGTSKYLAERLCEAFAADHGLKIICLRAAMVVPQHESPRGDPSAKGWQGAVHVDDALQAFSLALDDEGIAFDVFHVAVDGPHSKFDISKAKAKLGYRPTHRLLEPAPLTPARLVKGLLKAALRL